MTRDENASSRISCARRLLARAGLQPVGDDVLGADDLRHDLRRHRRGEHIIDALRQAVRKLVVGAEVERDVLGIQLLDGLAQQLHAVDGRRPGDDGVHDLEVAVVAEAVALDAAVGVAVENEARQAAGVARHHRHHRQVHGVFVVFAVHHDPHRDVLALHQLRQQVIQTVAQRFVKQLRLIADGKDFAFHDNIHSYFSSSGEHCLRFKDSSG